MSFDYSAAKAAIKKAGHTVSEGPHILATDVKEIVKFGRRIFGLSEVAVRKGIANPALLPEGFPGVASAPVGEVVQEEAAPAPEAAPVAVEAPVVPEETQAAQEAPEQDAAPAEDVQKAKKSKKDAQSAPAEDAPAGDQATQ